MRFSTCLAAFVTMGSAVTVGACNSGDADPAIDASPDHPDSDPGPPVYELSLVREERAELPGFTAELRAKRADGSLAPLDEVEIESSRGRPTSEVRAADGVYSRSFGSDEIGTGEYTVTARVGGVEVVRSTALVMRAVGSRWGQPRKVDGLVNTPAWEDGANITPDGQFLFVHYLPVTASCLIQAAPDVNSPECAFARGPVSGPERPGMPGANRVAADGSIQHGCPSIGLPSLPFPVPPNSLFGFRRQADGSFAEPFAVRFDGIDGCVSAFGMTTVAGEQAGAYTLVFAYDEPFDNDPPENDSQSDLYVLAGVALGAPLALGRYTRIGGDVELVDFEATRIAASVPGHFGNPAAFRDSSGRVQIWYDDETVEESARGLGALVFDEQAFPAGASTPPRALPAPFDGVGAGGAIQPFFDGQEALFRRGWDIASARYLGGDLFAAGSWSAAEAIVQSDQDAFISETAGAIVTTGEPTRAAIGERSEIYFVYAVIADDGTLDLNIGVVSER